MSKPNSFVYLAQKKPILFHTVYKVVYKIYSKIKRDNLLNVRKNKQGNKMNPVVELFFRNLFLEIFIVAKYGLQTYFRVPQWS